MAQVDLYKNDSYSIELLVKNDNLPGNSYKKKNQKTELNI